MSLVYTALRSHKLISAIDEALSAGDFHKLMEVAGIQTFESLIHIDMDSRYEQCAATDLRQPDLEDKLLSTHVVLISKFEKEIYDFPENVCCSCERLYQRKAVSVVKLSDDFKSEVWSQLKGFLLQNNPSAINDILYMCNYCKPMIKRDKMPSRCVLDGLQTVPIPKELAALDPLSRQLIQLAKCYQTIVRLVHTLVKCPHIIL